MAADLPPEAAPRGWTANQTKAEWLEVFRLLQSATDIIATVPEMLRHVIAERDTLRATTQRLEGERDQLATPLCIGQPTIDRLAREGGVQFGSGHALVAASDLFQASPYAALESEQAERDRLKGLLDRDKTGLGSALAKVRRIIGSYSWIEAGEWGSYDYTQRTPETLRAEIIDCFEQIRTITETALAESGTRANAAFHPEKDRIAELEAQHAETTRELENTLVALCKALVAEQVAHETTRRERDHLREALDQEQYFREECEDRLSTERAACRAAFRRGIEKAAHLLAAAKEMRNLLDEGVLVRDIRRDMEPGWAIRQMPLVLTLQKFVLAIEQTDRDLTDDAGAGSGE